MKILAVGMNYAEHCAEHGNERPEHPVIFTKCDSALLKDGKPFFIPDFTQECEYEAELVIHICRMGKEIAPRFAHRYYDAMTVGIDFTARDLQREARRKGLPWDLSKGFDNSAVIGSWVPTEYANMQNLNFHLDIDGRTVQRGWTGDMLWSVDEIIAYVSQFCMLRQGDLIFTGTPAGVGPVSINQHIEGYLENNKLLEFNVK
ncbi:MAG: fumarylacetoacetate hydrolase family protein [Bacteroidaceae bacterium]|nr:fumarylacetoacetate hydrolase family protein [Bacteroidaceae bacterium]